MTVEQEAPFAIFHRLIITVIHKLAGEAMLILIRI